MNTVDVEMLAENLFKEPCGYPGSIEIALSSAAEDPTEKFGTLERVSPDEMIAAFLLAIARDILVKAPGVDIWKDHLPSVNFKFLVLSSENARHFRQVKVRDQAVRINKAVGRSGFQRIYEFALFKAARERTEGKMTVAKIAELYAECVRNETKMTEGFVESALAVWNKALSIEAVNCAEPREISE